MKGTLTAIGATLLLALASCAIPISSNIASDVISGAVSVSPDAAAAAKLLTTDLQDASFNLNSAVAVGALAKDDPAPPCLDALVGQIIPPNPGPSFTPKVGGLVSLGSVLYIRAKQAQGLANGGIAMPVSCKSLVGDFVIQALAQAKNQLPGGGLLPTIR